MKRTEAILRCASYVMLQRADETLLAHCICWNVGREPFSNPSLCMKVGAIALELEVWSGATARRLMKRLAVRKVRKMVFHRRLVNGVCKMIQQEPSRMQIRFAEWFCNSVGFIGRRVYILFPRMGVRKVAAIALSLLYYFYWRHSQMTSGLREYIKKARPRRPRRLGESRPLLALWAIPAHRRASSTDGGRMRNTAGGEKEQVSNTDKINSGVRMPRSKLTVLDGLDINKYSYKSERAHSDLSVLATHCIPI